MKWTSDYLRIEKESYKYLFFIFTNPYIGIIENEEHQRSIEDGRDSFNFAIDRLPLLFEIQLAKDLKEHGAVISSFPEDRMYNFELLLQKPWPPDVNKMLRELIKPIILIISNDFKSFNPRKNPHIIINLSSFQATKSEIPILFAKILSVIHKGTNLYEWWENNKAVKCIEVRIFS